MSTIRDAVFVWTVPVAFLLHNVEEVLFMPQRTGIPRWSPLGWYQPAEFRLATLFLTAAVAGIALAVTLRRSRTTRYLLVGAQAMIFENALVHIAVSSALLRYTPGLVTAAFLSLPFSLVFFGRAVRQGVVARKPLLLFFLAGVPLMPVAIFLSLNLARLVTR